MVLSLLILVVPITTLPEIPTPPEITKAPVELLVLGKELILLWPFRFHNLSSSFLDYRC
jgi:hypothetical protein